MKTVRDDDGNRYLVLKQSGGASLVRDPSTGHECYVQNDRLNTVAGQRPLETAACGVSQPIRTILQSVHDDASLGLLIELADCGPMGVRQLLDRYDLCESDLAGRLAEFTAAGVLEETTVDGERGYHTTAECEQALEVLRSPVDSDD